MLLVRLPLVRASFVCLQCRETACGDAARARARSASSGGVRRGGDRGQAVPLLLIVMLVVVVAAFVVVRVGAQVDRRARAQTAADAAALAGARDGEAGARSLAAADGAVLESFVASGAEVEVVVRLGDERATARSRRSW